MKSVRKEVLHDTLDKMDFLEIYRAFQSKEAEYILLKCTWDILQDRSHLGPQIKPR